MISLPRARSDGYAVVARGQLPVTVVIPTYNRARLLVRALTSVFAQSVPPAEVIVVDDGSTDDTARMVREVFPSVNYLRQENRGVSSARNRGIAIAQKEWVALLDSDDEWLTGKLETQFRELARHPQSRVCHTEEIWMRRGVRVNPMKKHAKAGGWIFQRCLPLCAMSPSSILLHRTVFDTVGTFDEALPACEDYDLWLRITARYPVLFIDEPLIVKHGGHDDQLSRRYWGMDRFRIHALEKILAGDHLTAADRLDAVRTLAEKARIVATGARRRGRHAEAERYIALSERHVPR